MTLSAPRIALLPVLISLVTACSTPGLSIKGPGDGWFGDSDPRYKAEEDQEESEVPDFDPVFHEIDADLILEMERNPEAGVFDDYRLPEKTSRPEYTIGRGDVLSIIVFGHSDLTNPTGTTESAQGSGRLVNAKGNIFFPYAGDVSVAGKTVAEVRKELTSELSAVLRDPQVDVRVLEFRSREAYVVGDVSSPCVVPITDQPQTLLTILTACQSGGGSGGGAEGAGITAGMVKLQRNGNTYNIPLADLYLDPQREVYIRNGDRIVIDDRFSRVFMVGEFEDQTAVPISVGGLTLADAISAAGGLSLDTANAEAIYVIRGFVEEAPEGKPGIEPQVEPHVYKLDAGSVDAMILADRFSLQPRDVVFAAPASTVNLNRALAQLTPTLNLLFQTYLIFDRSNN